MADELFAWACLAAILGVTGYYAWPVVRAMLGW